MLSLQKLYKLHSKKEYLWKFLASINMQLTSLRNKCLAKKKNKQKKKQTKKKKKKKKRFKE